MVSFSFQESELWEFRYLNFQILTCYRRGRTLCNRESERRGEIYLESEKTVAFTSKAPISVQADSGKEELDIKSEAPKLEEI